MGLWVDGVLDDPVGGYKNTVEQSDYTLHFYDTPRHRGNVLIATNYSFTGLKRQTFGVENELERTDWAYVFLTFL